MKIAMILVTMLVGTISWAQRGADEAAIRDILKEEVAAWNKGDANALFTALRYGWNIYESVGHVPLIIFAGGYPSWSAMLAPTQVFSTLKSTPIILP